MHPIRCRNTASK